MTDKKLPSALSADEIYDRILLIVDTEDAAANRMMHETLVVVCRAALSDTPHAYGNLFSQVGETCRLYHLSTPDTIAVQRMRRDSNRRQPVTADDRRYDCRALALLVSAVTRTPVPTRLVERLPALGREQKERHRIDYRYIRCRVTRTDGLRIGIDIDQTDCPAHAVADLASDTFDRRYLAPLLREGLQLNLLDCTADGDGTIRPSLVVVEPDMLTDISSIAACFEEYGHHPLLYTVGRLRPPANTRHTLLGDFAGSALDDIVNDPVATTDDTFRTSFRRRALEYATCEDFDPVQFKADARRQSDNIRRAVDALFAGESRERALVEPSFVCEQLGIQGRVDLMTTDKRLLVEQKSGSNPYIARGTTDAHGSHYVEKHFVQVLLYYGVLRYNFNLRPQAIDVRLLYSKYPPEQGLLYVESLQSLFREALRLRNLIVAVDCGMARRGFADYIPFLTPERLNTARLQSSFYERYLLPQLREVTDPLHTADSLSLTYFARMATFVMREHLLSKVGTEEGVGECAADLWTMPLAGKREAGKIYTALTVVSRTRSDNTGRYDTLTLSVPDQGDDFLPNFRRGDMVYLYAYRDGEEPDARHAILFKGVAAEIGTDRLVIHLNDGQRNPRVFDLPDHGAHRMYWAVEHASSDASTRAAMRSLHEFLTAPADRRALILGSRAPRRDATVTLTRPYHPSYDGILLQSRQAKDYYLLVGPPGTGKTSMALRYIVEEELTGAGGSVLLMSYTNRAVDEICAMLLSAGIPFLRMGSEYSCDAAFRPYLVSQVADGQPRLDDLRRTVAGARVVVGTTSTLSARPFIFSLKRFSLAVVDEAGQITEPNIVGLLARHTGGDGQPLIGRFILVGDYKQLPAVVQQSPSESAVAEEALHGISLTDCRDSLFERLIRHERAAGRTDFIGVLRRQGRMHPDIAEWPNRAFYFREQLQPVPLPHQEEMSLGYPVGDRADALDRLLAAHRMVFLPSSGTTDSVSDKVNAAEADIVADVLARIHIYYGDRFDAAKTVGVIVPYRAQIAMIRKAIARRGLTGMDHVSIDTVERYQGSQREVIIYSFTIHHRWQLDFLTSSSVVEDGHVIDRKLNVAVTRARRQMIMTGNPLILRHNALFAGLLDYVRGKGGYIEQENSKIGDK